MDRLCDQVDLLLKENKELSGRLRNLAHHLGAQLLLLPELAWDMAAFIHRHNLRRRDQVMCNRPSRMSRRLSQSLCRIHRRVLITNHHVSLRSRNSYIDHEYIGMLMPITRSLRLWTMAAALSLCPFAHL
jgi:hypothetical protein